MEVVDCEEFLPREPESFLLLFLLLLSSSLLLSALEIDNKNGDGSVDCNGGWDAATFPFDPGLPFPRLLETLPARVLLLLFCLPLLLVLLPLLLLLFALESVGKRSAIDGSLSLISGESNPSLLRCGAFQSRLSLLCRLSPSLNVVRVADVVLPRNSSHEDSPDDRSLSSLLVLSDGSGGGNSVDDEEEDDPGAVSDGFRCLFFRLLFFRLLLLLRFCCRLEGAAEEVGPYRAAPGTAAESEDWRSLFPPDDLFWFDFFPEPPLADPSIRFPFLRGLLDLFGFFEEDDIDDDDGVLVFGCDNTDMACAFAPGCDRADMAFFLEDDLLPLLLLLLLGLDLLCFLAFELDFLLPLLLLFVLSVDPSALSPPPSSPFLEVANRADKPRGRIRECTDKDEVGCIGSVNAGNVQNRFLPPNAIGGGGS